MGALPTYKTTPRIIMTRPAPSADEVPREVAISATFDMPIDPATINGDHFIVSGQGGGRSGTVSYDRRSKTATFTPDVPFDPGETVQVQLTNGISSLWQLSMAVDYSWNFQTTTSTGAETPDPTAVPSGFVLQQNYPNPFNAETQIRFSMAISGHVELKIYDVLGRLVKTLVDEDLPAGEHRALWNGTDERGRALASGVYFCRLAAQSHGEVRRMVLAR